MDILRAQIGQDYLSANWAELSFSPYYRLRLDILTCIKSRSLIRIDVIIIATKLNEGQAGPNAGTHSLTSILANVDSDLGAPMTGVIIQAVPLPAALWLFSSGIITLLGLGRRKA